MKILIVPTVREIYLNQFEYCVDSKLIYFFKKLFSNSKIDIYNNKVDSHYNLIVLAGGNNSIIKKKSDLIRNKINNEVFNYSIKKKIKIIGICHGAHFLAKKFKFKLENKENHVGNHEVNFYINHKKFKLNVNSFHRETIKMKKDKKINIFGIANDNTIEAYHIKDKKILGIMWHPERYGIVKRFDENLLKGFYATNSIISR
jgi:gamma-glutamyl-gamma-aminobutyrate hydrolase PuuD